MAAYKDEERGTWYVSFYYEDWTGAKKRKVKRGFRTKKEALNFEAEYKRTAKADMDMTMGEFVEVYFRDKSQSLKDRSIKNKRDTMNAQLLPYFKDRPMNSITPAEIIQWQNTIIEKGYSDDYLKTIQNQMTALFNHAKNIYNLADNPCDKVKRMGKTSKKKMKFWTIEEYRQFMTGIEPGSKYYVLFELLFWTGAREGEALSITPADIDFEKNLLHINKTYYRMHGEDVITSPKTEESNRTISIPEFLKKEIQDYISRLYELPEDERIFPMVHEAVQHKLKQVVQKTGVKKIRVPDIRHSHAAFLINKGVQPLMIKERFGHTDIRITLNTYGHLYPDQQKVVADMLDDENIKSSGSTNNRSNVTNGDESTNVNPRQVDYSRDSSREQQRIGENSWENGGIYGTELKMIKMSDVQSQTVDWLWYPFIPYGKLTIIQGDPGDGKTTLILNIAARLSKGEGLDNDMKVTEPVNIIYQTAEDGLADTVKPRLELAEAVCERIMVIDETEKSLSMIDERLETAIKRTGARVLILDPIQAYLGGTMDMNRANEARDMTKRLSLLAEKYKCAILLIGHMNKAGGNKAAHRGMGSIDFFAVARSVLLVGRIEGESDLRAVVQIKNNLAAFGHSKAFRLTETGFEWIGDYEITADEVLGGIAPKVNKLEQAKKMLRELAKTSASVQSSEIFDKAEELNISKRTLENAKKELGIKARRIGNSWYWDLDKVKPE